MSFVFTFNRNLCIIKTLKKRFIINKDTFFFKPNITFLLVLGLVFLLFFKENVFGLFPLRTRSIAPSYQMDIVLGIIYIPQPRDESLAPFKGGFVGLQFILIYIFLHFLFLFINPLGIKLAVFL